MNKKIKKNDFIKLAAILSSNNDQDYKRAIKVAMRLSKKTNIHKYKNKLVELHKCDFCGHKGYRELPKTSLHYKRMNDYDTFTNVSFKEVFKNKQGEYSCIECYDEGIS